MTCQPDDLINECTVAWNVRNCILMYMFVCISTTVSIRGVQMYLHYHVCKYPMLAGLLCSLNFLCISS